jgi:hypothetical protein
MATHHLNMADRKLIDQITDIDVLTERIPRIQTFLQGVQEQRQLIASQGPEHRGQFTRTSGWWADGSTMYLGTLPVSVKAAIELIDPEFFDSKRPEKAIRFFRDHPEYIVTQVVP